MCKEKVVMKNKSNFDLLVADIQLVILIVGFIAMALLEGWSL